MTTDDRGRSRSADKARADGKREQATPRTSASKPPASRSADAPATAERGGSIAPQLIDRGDGSIGVAWRAIRLGPAHSYGCNVTCAPDHSLAVTLEQAGYRKTLTGAGSVDIAAIPVATSGTTGRLTATDHSTGGTTVRYEWQWRAEAGAAPSTLFRRQPAPTDLVRRGSGAPAARARDASVSRPIDAERVEAKSAERAAIVGDDAATVFFGQPARGKRFAFILDKSGSMAGARWAACRRECEGALNALVGAGEFCVVLFSSGIALPPGLDGWTDADAGTVAETIAWLAGVSPSGGTEPRPAFEYVYGLTPGPDVVYFLTDGQLFGFAAGDCARLRDGQTSTLGGVWKRLRGALGGTERREPDASVIHTISLDDRSSESALRTIAADSGGQYVAAKSTRS
jgi:hypothetical protein